MSENKVIGQAQWMGNTIIFFVHWVLLNWMLYVLCWFKVQLICRVCSYPQTRLSLPTSKVNYNLLPKSTIIDGILFHSNDADGTN